MLICVCKLNNLHWEQSKLLLNCLIIINHCVDDFLLCPSWALNRNKAFYLILFLLILQHEVLPMGSGQVDFSCHVLCYDTDLIFSMATICLCMSIILLILAAVLLGAIKFLSSSSCALIMDFSLCSSRSCSFCFKIYNKISLHVSYTKGWLWPLSVILVLFIYTMGCNIQ